MTSLEITGGELLPIFPSGSSGDVEVQLLEEIDDARPAEARGPACRSLRRARPAGSPA